MEPALLRHLPLITNRIQFERVSSPHATSVITPRIQFSSGQLEIDNRSGENAAIHSLPKSSHVSEMLVSDEGESELSDLSDSESEGLRPAWESIPKPPGEPGRPNSGGYNLESQLHGWTPKLFSEISGFVKNLADIQLDMTKSYNKQSRSTIASICSTTADHYPILSKYDNFWPARDILKMHLKYRAETSRKQHRFLKKTAKDGSY
ncbi:hypothetical protein CVT26_013411 [Gymnopilus dilepis]|uniref:Uncharacterized protein n=1 Tax=Gymnopilus dilepis TaxID=231916 RepID=A0A409VV03_9AGAR|nr:hypothetical protein CVT26_013411 [Gymnopilus dilepis]